jgi:thiol-disulfide isomerase/thioredoxin
MKTTFFIVFALVNGFLVSAQQTTTPAQTQPPVQPTEQQVNPPQPPAPYITNPTIPPFHLLKTDSATYVTKDDLKKHRRTMIMFFSPDCDHCKHQTESILAAGDKFKDIQIVMATYQPLSEMKDFNTHYRISDYPNMKIGRDEKFFLVPFFRIRNLPYLALYDKDGNLITTFEGTQKVDTILNAFKLKG